MPLHLVFFKAKKKYAQIQENIPTDVTKTCISFLEVDLLCEIWGRKYNKTIEKFKDQNLGPILHN